MRKKSKSIGGFSTSFRKEAIGDPLKYSKMFLRHMLPETRNMLLEEQQQDKDIMPFVFNLEDSKRSIEGASIQNLGLVEEANGDIDNKYFKHIKEKYGKQ